MKMNILRFMGINVEGVSKSLRLFYLKTDGPLRANFRGIKQGGYSMRIDPVTVM